LVIVNGKNPNSVMLACISERGRTVRLSNELAGQISVAAT
jgi:hypothetical protein